MSPRNFCHFRPSEILLGAIISVLQSIFCIAVKAEYCTLLLIIESVDSISRDERDAPLTQYITNAGITQGTLSCILNKTIVFYG